MSSCKQTMLLLGESIDKMRERGADPDELELCIVLANGMYFLCLYMRHIQRMNDGTVPEIVEEKFDVGVDALHQMLEKYRDTEDETVLKSTIDGIRAVYNFQEAKRAMNELLVDQR